MTEGVVGVSGGFEDRAEAWLAFARTKGHDAYWSYRDAFFDLLPAPPARALEVGCGEGRVCRDLASRGYETVGLDASVTLVAAAASADPDGVYVTGLAEALPFADESFDLVVSYNSLMDVVDMPSTLAEIGRVLRSGGRFCACVLHPLIDAGRFAGDSDAAPFVVEGSYFEEREYEVLSERDGISFLFRSRRYTLASYWAAIAAAGMTIDAVLEPRHPAEGSRWQRLPMFLCWTAIRL